MTAFSEDRIASCMQVLAAGDAAHEPAVGDFLGDLEDQLEDLRIRIEAVVEALPVMSTGVDLETALQHVHRAYVSYDYLHDLMGEVTLRA